MVVKPKFISFEGLFPRLYNQLPGLIKGTYYAITAATGVGKTKYTKFLLVDHAYKYCKANDIPLNILYFALEESADKFWITIACDLLYERYKTTITYYQYKRFHPGMTPEIEEQLKSIEPIIEDMKQYITVLDYISNPTGLFKTVRNHMDRIGVREDGIVEKDEFGNEYKSFNYTYDNPDTHVIVIVDHVSLMSPEKNQFSDCSTTHAAMSKWSEYVVRYICKKYQCIVCNVHQQQMSGDNVENLKNDNLQPAMSKLADNLLIGRDYHVVFSIFNPSKYKSTSKDYGGYDLTMLKDHFREISVLKHRDGKDSFSSPMYFNGKINYYKELPIPEDKKLLDEVYRRIKIDNSGII